MKWCYKISATVLTICCLLVTGCNSKEPEVASSVPVEATELGQTITVINPDSTSNNAVRTQPVSNGEKYQIQTRLTDFQLLSDTTGLAWGTTSGELRLYLTKDNGETWTNISPATAVQFPSNPEYGKEIFFKDSMNGWIVRNSIGASEAMILRTRDGGGTWKLSSLRDSDEVAAMYFNDIEHGWILTVDNKAIDNQGKTLYVSEDGGATWSSIMSNQALPTTKKVDQVLPKSANFVSMIFTDQKNGYVSTMKSGLPALYVTEDGGMDWKENTSFFNPAKYQTCKQFTVGETTPFVNDRSTGWIPIGCSRDDGTKFNGYFTEDAGQSWQLVPFKLSWQTDLNEYSEPTFLNSKEGWTIQGDVVYRTIDQGNNWTPLPESPRLKKTLQDYPEVVKLRFISSNVGWLLVAKTDQKRSLLLQTQNGGISWRVL